MPEKILIIEDEDVLGKAYQMILEDFYDVKWVMTAEKGEELVNFFQPDLILLDHGLPAPGKNGITAIPHLKKCFPDAKIIIFSNYDKLVKNRKKYF